MRHNLAINRCCNGNQTWMVDAIEVHVLSDSEVTWWGQRSFEVICYRVPARLSFIMLKFTCKTLIIQIILPPLLPFQPNLGHRCTLGPFNLWCHRRSHGKVKGHFRSKIKVYVQDSLMGITWHMVLQWQPNLDDRCTWGIIMLCCRRRSHGTRSKDFLGQTMKLTCKTLLWHQTWGGDILGKTFVLSSHGPRRETIWLLPCCYFKKRNFISLH